MLFRSVHDQQIVEITCVIMPITDNLDSMSTESFPSFVLVNPTLIGQEIFINSKGACNGSILSDLGVNLLMAQ